MNLNKIMSMIIGTAVVTSIVPVSAVNASVKLQVLDGVIYEAKAFSNGKYVFEGYKNDDQDNGVYFFDGKNDIEIEDANAIGNRYGMNYINFAEDEILFNMATGKVEEDDEESKLAMIESKFRSSVVKKADRYKNTKNLIKLGKISEDTFSGIWYEYLVAENDDITNPGENYTVYLSDSGKYVDVSEKLDITHYDEEGNKITLKDYSDLEKNGLNIILQRPLLLDQQNIYRLVVIGENLQNSTTYIQRISMEQGDKEDGAYLPKKVTSFEAYDFDVIGFLTEHAKGNNTARVSGDNLYTMELNSDKDTITMKKYSLKKIKDKKSVEGKSLDKRVLELDDDFDYVKNEKIQDYAVDALGNLWILYKGKIQKFENGKLETKYTVDRTMNRLSVFAENSLIVWNTDNEIYSVVAPVEDKKDEDKKDEVVENPSENDKSDNEVEFKSGWIKNSDGTWNFKKEDGSLAVGWLKDNSTWYYLNAQGAMQTGWLKDAGTWYYLNGSGAMQTGWVKVGTEWYYLNASGAMQTGWIKDTNGKWYYLYNNGVMAHSTVVNGYKLDASGVWIQ